MNQKCQKHYYNKNLNSSFSENDMSGNSLNKFALSSGGTQTQFVNKIQKRKKEA